MDAFIANVSTAAMVIGFPTLLVVGILVLWFGSKLLRDLTKIYNETQYERRTRKNEERNQSNLASSWVLEPYEDYEEDTTPFHYFNNDTDVIPRIPGQRHDTLELPQLYNLQEDRT